MMTTYHFSEGAMDLPDEYATSAVHSFVREIDGRTGTIVMSSTPESGDALERLNAAHEARGRHVRRLRVLVPPRALAQPPGAAMTSWEFLHESLGVMRVTEVMMFSQGRQLSIMATSEVAIGDALEAELGELLRTLRFRRIEP
jgi:hypothetical protein